MTTINVSEQSTAEAKIALLKAALNLAYDTYKDFDGSAQAEAAYLATVCTVIDSIVFAGDEDSRTNIDDE